MSLSKGLSAKLQYLQQAATSVLATQKSRVIGAIIPNLLEPVSVNTVEILQHCLQRNDFTLPLRISNYDKQEEFREIQALAGQVLSAFFCRGGSGQPSLRLSE
ncbi:hypothetical protein ACVFVO_14595 [Advenella kashmirensis]